MSDCPAITVGSFVPEDLAAWFIEADADGPAARPVLNARRLQALIAEVERLRGHVRSKHEAMKLATRRADAIVKGSSDEQIELTALRREYATRLIYDKRASEDEMNILIWLKLHQPIDTVVAGLVVDHVNDPVGKCQRCGNDAPLTDERVAYADVIQVCAWGCEP